MERRSHPRIQPHRPVVACLFSTAKWRDNPYYIGRVHNFSIAGAFIESARPVIPGQRLPIRFLLGGDKTFEIKAIVRRVEPLRGAGVEFLQMNGAGVRFLCNCWGDESQEERNERADHKG